MRILFILIILVSVTHNQAGDYDNDPEYADYDDYQLNESQSNEDNSSKDTSTSSPGFSTSTELITEESTNREETTKTSSEEDLNSEVTSTTDGVSVLSTTPDPNSPCGTFIKYDPINSPNDPEIYGFEGGIGYKENVKQFVGYGNFTSWNCLGENPTPGGVQITASIGVHIICKNQPIVDKKSAFYLLKHPNLKWISTTTSRMFGVPGTLKLGYGSFPTFYFGRTIYKGEYRVGKVHASRNFFDGLWIETEDGEKERGEFEVLVCEDPMDTTTSTTEKVEEYEAPNLESPCGTFVKLHPTQGLNDPETFGFAGGNNYKDNSVQFVGYGNFPNYCTEENPAPGGVQVTEQIGTHITCQNKPFVDKKSAFYLLKNPNLKWIQTDKDKVKKLKNLLKSDSSLLFGRVRNHGKYLLGKVHASGASWDGLWIEIDGEEKKIESNFEVLACVDPEMQRIEEFEEKIEEKDKEIEEKGKKIGKLEGEVEDLRQKISNLEEKIQGMENTEKESYEEEEDSRRSGSNSNQQIRGFFISIFVIFKLIL